VKYYSPDGSKIFATQYFEGMCVDMARDLVYAKEVDVGEWQAQRVDHPLQVTKEIQSVIVEMQIPLWVDDLQRLVHPNLPWAEDHFKERVSGEPLNPPPSEAWWPHAQQSNEAYKRGEKFSHTYPERFWPKRAERLTDGEMDVRGIRFAYGDLRDVVDQLGRKPLTRQAYLPVWFPEDTGAVHKERVPCSLGYHFLCRNNTLDMTYFIRSCDFVRHFRDDVYMAGRLLQWMKWAIHKCWRVAVEPGSLTMHIVSLHIFKGDVDALKKEYKIG
jgi:hypothetical protein